VGCDVVCSGNYQGAFSSIHLLGRLTTFISICTGGPASSLSANRDLSGRTGQGRMLEAETVIQAAKNVRPKSEETNERRWVRRRTLWIDILDLERVRDGRAAKKKQS